MRSRAIDILRLVAVLLVVARHLEIPSTRTTDGFESALVTGLHWLHRGGWVGVDLFFVLSGFLVSGLLFQEYALYGRILPGRFLLRRGLKIYPPFWALMVFTLGVAAQFNAEFWGRFFAEFCFLQNYLPGIWNHTWSLAIEEHFYLMLLLLLLVLSRRKQADPWKGLPVFCLGLAICCLLGRLWIGSTRAFDFPTHMFATHLRIDSLFFGVTLAHYQLRYPEAATAFSRRWRRGLLALGLLLLAPPFYWAIETTPLMASFGYTGLYLGSGLLLVAALSMEPPDKTPWRGLAFLGKHSYSIYLWHTPILWFLVPLLQYHTGPWTRGSATVCLEIALVLSIGVAMSLLIEAPTIRLRDRWFPTRSQRLPADQSKASR